MDPIAKYKKARQKLILLDYDGTLVNFTIAPEDAKPSVRVLNILYKLSCNPTTKLIIITGREYRSIDKMIGHLPIDIVAEHGAMVKENGLWNDRVKHNILWKHEFLPLLNQISSECTGSFVEEKRFSIAWHYRNVDLLGGYIFSRELIRMTQNKVHRYGLRIVDGAKTVEIMTNETNKGKLISTFIEKTKYDYVLSIGDGATDEDMFQMLKDNENCITIKVGYGNTSADHRLDPPEDVIRLLEKL